MGYGRRLLRYLAGEFLRNKLLYMLLFVIMVTGFAFGMAAPVSMDAETAAQCRAYIGDYLTLLPTAQIDCFAEFLRALRLNGAILAVILLAGLHLVGVPLIAAALFYKAFTIGFAAGFLLNYQSMRGFLIIVFSILPQNMLLLPLLLWAAGEAVSFSLLLWRGNNSFAAERRRLLSRYGLFSLALCGFILVSALIQGYLSPLLLELFFLIRT